ncbi:FtsB family cell division protein [Streptococcus dentapri]|uniref:Septum formation initiator family protein n=1 Tax=Streptococcus dentapri TaxID=573564 RepID=A0ABV8D1U8_9STRE
MSNKDKVVQLNNDYIKENNLYKRYEEEETRKRHRFMGWTLIFVILLFVLPTYNLVSSYRDLQSKKAQIVKLKKEYQTTKEETTKEETLANQLKDNGFVEKYARAKYHYSDSDEVTFIIPELVPQ